MEILQPAPGRTVIDATFGRGGHSRALLARGARVIALDVDPEAEVAAKTLATEVGTDRFCFHRENFGQLAQVMEKEGPVDGLLLIWGFPRLKWIRRSADLVSNKTDLWICEWIRQRERRRRI